MKAHRLLLLASAIAFTVAGNRTLSAAEAAAPAVKSSAEFERMKTLVGDWKGSMNMGQGPVEMNVSYRLLAGGSALEERTFVGTPKEMVTMYYDRNGKLALTHYCAWGNRPEMAMASSDQKSIRFAFDPGCGLDPKSGSLMHSLAIEFTDRNTITMHWRAVVKGQATPPQPIRLTRVR